MGCGSSKSSVAPGAGEKGGHVPLTTESERMTLTQKGTVAGLRGTFAEGEGSETASPHTVLSPGQQRTTGSGWLHRRELFRAEGPTGTGPAALQSYRKELLELDKANERQRRSSRQGRGQGTTRNISPRLSGSSATSAVSGPRRSTAGARRSDARRPDIIANPHHAWASLEEHEQHSPNPNALVQGEERRRTSADGTPQRQGDGTEEEDADVERQMQVLNMSPEQLIAEGYGVDDLTNSVIVGHLQSAESTASDIQRLFQSTVAVNRSLPFYVLIGELLIQKGEPLMAEEILYQGTQQFSDKRSIRLRQLHGLALAQGGSTDRAIRALESLREEGGFDDESGGLLARCYKDKANREPDPWRRMEFLSKAHAIYSEAFQGSGRTSYYTGINTATMALLLGRASEAQQVAHEVTEICRGEMEEWDGPDHAQPGAYWLLATLGEAHVIEGDLARAAQYYARARACAPRDYVKIASSQRQLRLLLDHISPETAQSPQNDEDDDAAPEINPTVLQAWNPSSNRDLRRSDASAMKRNSRVLSPSPRALRYPLPTPVSTAEGANAQDGGGVSTRRMRFSLPEEGDEAATASPATAPHAEHPLNSPRGIFAPMFDLPSVVVFIPAEQEEALVPCHGAQLTLARQLEHVLERLNCGFGYSSASSLPEILFLEAVRRRGGEIYITLPVPLDVHLQDCERRFAPMERYLRREGSVWLEMDEERRSLGLPARGAVSPRGGSAAPTMEGELSLVPDGSLTRRLRALVASAARVDVSNDMSPEASATNRHYCGLIVDGLAMKRARALGTYVERIFLKPDVAPAPGSPDFLHSRRDSSLSGHLVVDDGADAHGRNIVTVNGRASSLFFFQDSESSIVSEAFSEQNERSSGYSSVASSSFDSDSSSGSGESDGETSSDVSPRIGESPRGNGKDPLSRQVRGHGLYAPKRRRSLSRHGNRFTQSFTVGSGARGGRLAAEVTRIGGTRSRESGVDESVQEAPNEDEDETDEKDGKGGEGVVGRNVRPRLSTSPDEATAAATGLDDADLSDSNKNSHEGNTEGDEEKKPMRRTVSSGQLEQSAEATKSPRKHHHRRHRHKHRRREDSIHFSQYHARRRQHRRERRRRAKEKEAARRGAAMGSGGRGRVASDGTDGREVSPRSPTMESPSVLSANDPHLWSAHRRQRTQRLRNIERGARDIDGVHPRPRRHRRLKDDEAAPPSPEEPPRQLVPSTPASMLVGSAAGNGKDATTQPSGMRRASTGGLPNRVQPGVVTDIGTPGRRGVDSSRDEEDGEEEEGEEENAAALPHSVRAPNDRDSGFRRIATEGDRRGALGAARGHSFRVLEGAGGSREEEHGGEGEAGDAAATATTRSSSYHRRPKAMVAPLNVPSADHSVHLASASRESTEPGPPGAPKPKTTRARVRRRRDTDDMGTIRQHDDETELAATAAAVEQWVNRSVPFRVLFMDVMLLPGTEAAIKYREKYLVAPLQIGATVLSAASRPVLPPPPALNGELEDEAEGAEEGGAGSPGAPSPMGANSAGGKYDSVEAPSADPEFAAPHLALETASRRSVGTNALADWVQAAIKRSPLGEKLSVVKGRSNPLEEPLVPGAPRLLDLVPALARAVREGEDRVLPTKKQAVQRQVVMAMLFADIVGYSKLGEMQVLNFQENFLGAVSNLIKSLPRKRQPLVRNTWGDAFYFVFARVPDAGEFALALSDLVTRTPWEMLNLPKSLSIRISLHAAPVHVVTDPVIGLRNYTGVHTSRAARIEPITPPGSVYCSQAFAAIAEALLVESFDCEYVGNMPLAKNYGLQPVYHVRWAARIAAPPKPTQQLSAAMQAKLKAMAQRARERAAVKALKEAADREEKEEMEEKEHSNGERW